MTKDKERRLRRAKEARLDTMRIPIWLDQAERLARVLEQMQDGEFLIISVKNSNRYVQFSAQGARGFRVESTCNTFPKAADQLGPQALRKLRALGWREPTGDLRQSTPMKDPEGSPNFHQDFELGDGYAAMAELTVRTLREVHHAPSPIFLEYCAFDERGNQLSYDELWITRTIYGRTAKENKLGKMLRRAMRECTGLAELDYETDGKLCLAYGAAILRVEVVGTLPIIEFSTVLVHSVGENRAVLEWINELNQRHAEVKFVRSGAGIKAATSVLAHPFIAGHVVSTMNHLMRVIEDVWILMPASMRHGRKKPRRHLH